MDFERSLTRQDIFEGGKFSTYMTISLGCHIIIMAFMIVTSGFSGCERRSFSSQVIDVDLMSDMPAAGGGAAEPRLSQPEESPPASPAPQAPAPKVVSTPPPAVTAVAMEKSTNKVKKALKEKTFNPGQSVENAVARLEKQVDQQAPSDSVAQAIARLRQAEQDRQQSVTVSGGPGVGGGSPGGRSGKELEAIEIYKLEVRYHILKNWAFSSQLAGNEESLKTVIGITIAADGHITKTWFDRRSGNEYYDDSAYKAVLKSDPLPGLPGGYRYYTVGLEFTPSDLR